MKKWPHEVRPYSPDEVQEYCVRDVKWQAFRKSLKGLPTEEKLFRLNSWHKRTRSSLSVGRITQVQIDNYINALKRGGQLNMDLEVQR